MATPPDFTTGQVLTASQMNGVGLWLVKTVTVGTAVSSVPVTDAFSADFDYYKITYTNGVGSTSASMNLQLGATVTGYVWAIVIGRYDNVGSLSGGNQNDTAWKNVGFTDADGNLFECEVTQPFQTKKTGFIAWHWDSRFGGGTGFGSSGGHLRNTTSYTGFTLSVTSGTMTGGTIRVYGYRK
jgi:hypothetical protein